jgi:hypothetical protein
LNTLTLLFLFILMDRDITQAKQDVVSVYMIKQKKANLLLKK